MQQQKLFGESNPYDDLARMFDPKKGRKGRFTSEELKVVNLRKKLMTECQIGRNTYLTLAQMRGVFRAYFGNDDPLHLHIIESIRRGETGKAISRRLRMTTATISKIANKHGISLALLRGQGVKKSPPQKRDDESLAHDLYCMVKDGLTIVDISRRTGFCQSEISRYLNKYIAEYKEASVKRRAESKESAKDQRRFKLSSKYKSESEFSQSIQNRLKPISHIESNIRGESKMEIDLLIRTDSKTYLAELKITSRMVDEARALGQALLNKHSFSGGECEVMIVCPDDTVWSRGFKELCAELGVCVCDEGEIERLLTC